jgi:hypothetical protein
MGFPRLGFLGAIGAFLLGAAASSSRIMLEPNEDYGVPTLGDFIPSHRRGRSYGSHPGERAHRRWRKARASGRHDFRRTLKRKAA